MAREIRQTVVIGPEGRFEGRVPEIAPGTRAEIVLLFSDTKTTEERNRREWLEKAWTISDEAIANGMETWDLGPGPGQRGDPRPTLRRPRGALRLSYVDSGVVISAWRTDSPLRTPARAVLSDPSRQIIMSSLVRLETLPKAIFRRSIAEVAYDEAVFASVARWIDIHEAVVKTAIGLGSRYDVVNLDALHVAAAIRAGVDQLVTTERPGKPLFRVTEVGVVSLLDL